MKKFLLSTTIFLSVVTNAQIGIDTESPDKSAILDIVSTNKGVLLPRMTEEQREAIASPAEGLIIYNTTKKILQINTGTTSTPEWRSFSMNTKLTADLKCETIALQGTLKKGKALSTENLSITVNVTELATEPSENDYSIETDSPNGYKFSASGTFTRTGEQTITLQGSGIPTNAQTDNLTLTFKNKSCDNIKTEVTSSEPKIVVIGNAMFGSSYLTGNPAYFENGNTGWAETIYSKSQIGTSGTITSISYLVDQSGNCRADIPNQKIYMKLVDNSSFSNSSQEDINTMKKVFEGTITWVKGATPETAWTRIELKTPFEYDNKKNLLISFINDSGKDASCLAFFGTGPAFVADTEGATGEVSKYYRAYNRKSKKYPVIKLEFN